MPVLVEWTLFGETQRSEFSIPGHAESFCMLLYWFPFAKLVRVTPCT
jgi:hypothetical protein